MTARKLAAMTAEDREAKVEALSPAWAKDYIRQLEGLTRALHAQLVAAQAGLAGVTEIADHARDELRQRDSEDTPAASGECPLHPRLPVPGCTACEAMGLAAWQERYARHTWLTPPAEFRHATARVLDGAANMEPLADLPDQAEVRFADFYQVHYGDHATSGGARALIVETDAPLVIRPVNQATVIISRASG